MDIWQYRCMTYSPGSGEPEGPREIADKLAFFCRSGWLKWIDPFHISYQCIQRAKNDPSYRSCLMLCAESFNHFSFFSDATVCPSPDAMDCHGILSSICAGRFECLKLLRKALMLAQMIHDDPSRLIEIFFKRSLAVNLAEDQVVRVPGRK
jgi:hypothetical protein